uniref:Uncharacterized protein n=1 Tax=Rhizophora mucronata TaxID=61149 RepID=A0A2P2QNC1_RHIMU
MVEQFMVMSLTKLYVRIMKPTIFTKTQVWKIVDTGLYIIDTLNMQTTPNVKS